MLTKNASSSATRRPTKGILVVVVENKSSGDQEILPPAKLRIPPKLVSVLEDISSDNGSFSSAPDHLWDREDDEEYHVEYLTSTTAVCSTIKEPGTRKDGYHGQGLSLSDTAGVNESSHSSLASSRPDDSSTTRRSCCSCNCGRHAVPNPRNDSPYHDSRDASSSWRKVGTIAMIGVAGFLFAFAVGEIMGERRAMVARQTSQGRFFGGGDIDSLFLFG
jgi:hypothetical protein